MAKPLKIVLWIVGVFALLLVAAAVALPLLFDPNDYREQIQKAVKDSTGRDFSFSRVDLGVFPWLHVSLHEAKLGNAPDFTDAQFAEIGEASVGVRLMPLLFDHQVRISTLKLNGLKLNLARDKAGKDNWSDIGAQKKETPATPAPATAHGKVEFNPSELEISGVELKDAALSFTDAQAGKSYKVDQLELSTGSINLGKSVDVSGKGHVAATAPKADLELGLKASVLPDLAANKVQVDKLSFTVKGQALDYAADARLEAQIAADLGAKQFHVSGLDLTAALQGASLPGGKQELALSGDLLLDQAAGTLALSNAKLKAAGVVVETTIKGEGLNGATPRLSGPIKVAPFNPHQVLTAIGQKLDTSDPNALQQASLSANYSGSFSSANLEQLELKLDQSTVQGNVFVRDFPTQAIEFALKVDAIDADRYMAPPAKGEAAAASSGGSADINAIKLPTDAIAKLNANGTIDIGSLKLKGAKLTDVRLKLSGAGSAPREQEVTAKLYGGTFSTSNRISPGATPSFALKTELSALDAAPFLKDFAGKDYISGLGNVTMNLNGAGDTVGAVRRALGGDVGFHFDNGSIKGFNLASILRRAQATLGGNLNYQEEAPQQTDFSTISGTAKIINGILKSDSLQGASPGIRLGGSGQVDLVNLTVDYLAQPTVVETSTGQGGKTLENLKGLMIPIRVTGPLSNLSYKIDLQSALQAKAGERLQQQEDKAKDKLKSRLGDILFGKQKQQQQQAPAQQQPAQSPPPEQKKP
jgi:AsmA protein